MEFPLVLRLLLVVLVVSFIIENVYGNLELDRNSIHKPWTYITYALTSTNILDVLINSIMLLLILHEVLKTASWTIEDIVWSLFVGIASGSMFFQVYSVLRSLIQLPTFEKILCLDSIILSSSLILLQANPSKTLLTIKNYKLSVQKIPFLLLALYILKNVLIGTVGLVLIDISSWFWVYVYIRFMRITEGSRGDHSDSLSFENMVPTILKPLGNKMASIVFSTGLQFDRFGLLSEWNISYAPFTSVLPQTFQNHKFDIERKREMGTKLMNERLNTTINNNETTIQNVITIDVQ